MVEHINRGAYSRNVLIFINLVIVAGPGSALIQYFIFLYYGHNAEII